MRDGAQVELEIGCLRNGERANAVGGGRDGVHTVGGRAVDERVAAGLAEGAHQQFDAFVAAACDEYVFRRHLCVAGVGGKHLLRLRFGVAVERDAGSLNVGGGGGFVGVEPHFARAADAARGLVRDEVAQFGAGELGNAGHG